MQLTIVVPDNKIGVNGVFYEVAGLVDLVPADLHALQWRDDRGEEEYPDGNELITSLASYQSALDAWEQARLATIPPPLTLTDVKASKIAEINAWKNTQRQTFEWNGHTWDSDDDGRANVMGVVLAGIAPPSGYWTSADNIDVPITTLTEMQSMYGAMVAKAGAVHDRQRAMKLAVEDMTDVQAILDYPVGW